MNSKYKVSIIPQNLSRQKTIVQIAEVLEHLSTITDNVISHLDQKLTNTENQLGLISERIANVNSDINKLNGSKTAIQVFSSSKYPASDVYHDYESVFNDCPDIVPKRFPVMLKNVYSTYEPLDKLYFYHVSVSSDSKERNMRGLGDIPTDITFVNNLQLYNSGTNVYKNFEITNSLKGPQNIYTNEKTESESELGAAPPSISERLNVTRSFSQNYFYTPQIGEVPALNVPLDLPDLPGIADNLHFESNPSSTIAPSTAISTPLIENLDNLPNIQFSTKPVNDKVIENLPPPPPLPADLPPPPPLPQVEPPVDVKHERSETVPMSIKAEEIKLPLITALPTNDVRSSLMEAIRKAGGSEKAKLKSINKSEESSQKVIQGGDLMADLHNKLFMRRKGISGAKKPPENAIDSSSTLGRISAMIPAPEPSNVESTSNDEEDWD